MQRIADEIFLARTAKRLSQSAYAKRFGTSRQAISIIERGVVDRLLAAARKSKPVKESK